MKKGAYYWCSLMRYLWTVLTVFILLFLFSACGRKLDPNLDDYLQPEPVPKLTLSGTYEKILISWKYPEKAKAKIESFLIERETDNEKKTLGYYDKNTTSLEDRDFTFGKTYTYHIFAIRPKGIYSKPTKASITPQKLPDVENIQYKITPQGVMLSWNSQNSLNYNIYRINQKGERVKIGSTDKNQFLDELLHSTISAFTDFSKSEIPYVITNYMFYESTYIEGKGTQINVAIESFIPSKPEGVFWSINEQGVYISWREAFERWISGYKIYRKSGNQKDFKLIGKTVIPLFFDTEYNINNTKSPLYYKITTEGPLRESEPIEIKVEVQVG